MDPLPQRDTLGTNYAQRLATMSEARWKRILNVQAPYGWNVRRVCEGTVLDVGCGIGRNLTHLRGRGTGVDHNVEAVRMAREKGLRAYSDHEFFGAFNPMQDSWDTLLVAHVLEHMDDATADALLSSYLPFIKDEGRLVMVCPQEWAYARDATHLRWVDSARLAAHARTHGFHVVRSYSFPWTRSMGKWAPYGEFVVVAERSISGGSTNAPEDTSPAR